MTNTNRAATVQRIVRNRLRLARRSMSNGQPVRGIITWQGRYFIPVDLSQVVGLSIGDRFTACNNGRTWDLEIIETVSGYTAIVVR